MKTYNDIKQYLLPDTYPVVISFSGGRSSGLMLVNILKAYNHKLPDHVYVVFSNTGGEHNATLDFVHEFEKRYDLDIHWLEFYRDDSRKGVKGDPKNIVRRVNYETASRKMEPFISMCMSRSYLPNQNNRVCTVELKIAPKNRYCKNILGLGDWFSVIGFRGDEIKRVDKSDLNSAQQLKTRELSLIFPLAMDDIDKDMVDRFWKQNDFDLGIPSYLGNCVFCFLKAKPKLAYIMHTQAEESGLDRWIDLEKQVRSRKTDYVYASFINGVTYEQMSQQRDIVMELEDDAGGIDCFCTD